MSGWPVSYLTTPGQTVGGQYIPVFFSTLLGARWRGLHASRNFDTQQVEQEIQDPAGGPDRPQP